MDPIIGAALIGGGTSLLSGLLGGGNSTAQSNTSEPWSVARPSLRGLMSGAYDWYQSGAPQEFPFSTDPWFTPEQDFGMSNMAARSYYGSPAMNQAGRLALGTMGGDYMNPASNPYLRSYYDQANSDLTNSFLNATLPQLKSTSQSAGMGNSTADALLKGQLFRQLGDSQQKLATNIYGGAYGTERQNQLNAMNFAPTLAANELTDLQNFMAVGDVKQQKAQSVLGELKNVWDTRQSQPYNRLAQYANMVMPLAGMGGSQVQNLQSQSPNMAQNLIGGAMAGAALGKAFQTPQINYQAPSFGYQPTQLAQQGQLQSGYGMNYGIGR